MCQCFTLILNFLAVETEIQKVKVCFLFLRRWESAGNVRVRILIILDTMSFFIISVSLNSYWGIGILSDTGHKKEIRTESFRTPEHSLLYLLFLTGRHRVKESVIERHNNIWQVKDIWYTLYMIYTCPWTNIHKWMLFSVRNYILL